MKINVALLTISLVAPLGLMALSGCMYQEPASLPPGQYEQNSKSVNSHGTVSEDKSTTDVYYDKYGNKKVTVDRKSSTDPKGLFNKSTTETHTIVR